MTGIPLRDLTDTQQRGLIGKPVTVKVYEDVEETEPEAVLHGRLAVIALTDDYTVIMFEHQIGAPAPVPASSPITVEWLS
jgi:hypothetical protein